MSDRREEAIKHRKQVAAELKKLKRLNGAYDPEDVVSWAKSHPKSKLHSLFEWDDSEAAAEYRKLQARHVLKIYLQVESIGGIEDITLISVPSLRRSGSGSFRDSATVASHEDFRVSVLTEIKSKLRDFRKDYETLLPELKPVWAAIRRTCDDA